MLGNHSFIWFGGKIRITRLPVQVGLSFKNSFWGTITNINTFVLNAMLNSGCFRIFWLIGWVAEKSDNITKLSPAVAELGNDAATYLQSYLTELELYKKDQ